jgi:hypothetical protein
VQAPEVYVKELRFQNGLRMLRKDFLLLLLAFYSHASLKVMSCLLWSIWTQVMSAVCICYRALTWSVNILLSICPRKSKFSTTENSLPEFKKANE